MVNHSDPFAKKNPQAADNLILLLTLKVWWTFLSDVLYTLIFLPSSSE